MTKKKRALQRAEKHNIENQAPVSTMDAFSNPAARIGWGTMDLMNGTSYPMTRMTQNYELLTSMYRDNWIIQNIVATVPNDMIRKWYQIKSSITPEQMDQLTKLERKIQLRKRLLLGMYWGRLYGGAVGVILVKGQDDLSQPLDLDAVLPGSFLGMQILDRWSGVYPEGELVKEPSDPDYGLPAFYTIRDDTTGYMAARVHHSRIVRFIGRELPWMEQVAELYWGESEIEAIYNEVVRRDNVAANIAALTFRANVNYMETEGLDQLLGTANTEMQRRFWNVMAAQAMMESNFGTRIINKGDAIHNTQYTFTGLPEVYDRVMMDVAGAARIPVTKLFGRSPAGLNSTGESDMQNYYDYIDGLRENELRPVIERLLPLMALSALGEIPDDLEIDFPPMQTADAKEQAEITERNTNSILAAYQNDLIDAATAQQELQAMGEETGIFSRISDETIEAARGQTYTKSRLMADPMAGLEIAGTPPEEPVGKEW
ncbi:phage-related protein, HI1409 family [butyrate-producing bacterium SM4/1]|nr:phage-related protein, HI1409 family [butyrate-producing bacterium SM4/1]